MAQPWANPFTVSDSGFPPGKWGQQEHLAQWSLVRIHFFKKAEVGWLAHRADSKNESQHKLLPMQFLLQL